MPRSSKLARPGAAADQGQRLPQLEIGAARRAGAVLDETDFAIGKGAGAMRRREHRPGIQEGPRPERSSRGRRPNTSGFAETFGTAPGSASRAGKARRIDCPIALDRPQLCGRMGDRGDADPLRVEPDIAAHAPRGVAAPERSTSGRASCRRQAELMVEFLGKSLRGEVSNASAHGRQHRAPGLTRRGHVSKLPGMAIRSRNCRAFRSDRANPPRRRLSRDQDRHRDREFQIPQPRRDLTPMAPIDFRISSPRRRRDAKPGGGVLQWRRPFALPPPTEGPRRRRARPPRSAAAVITQNIDGLRQASGIAEERVIGLHGNTIYAHCLDCRTRNELEALRVALKRDETAPVSKSAAAL